MTKVLCFGNLQLDILCRPVTGRHPAGAFTPIAAIDVALGGNGGNVAMVLARLGIAVELAGYSGADLFAAQLRALLAEGGVGLSKLLCHPSIGSGISVIDLAPGGERSGRYVNGANAAFDLDTVPDSWLDVAVVSLGSLFVLPKFSGAAAGRLLERAHQHGATTVLNVCWDTEGGGFAALKPALAAASLTVISMADGRRLTGDTTPAGLLASLAEHSPGAVIVTLGAAGCCFHSAGAVEYLPSVPVVATDTTGAGDSFVAGLIAGLVLGQPLRTCARLASQVAAYAVTGPGAYSRTPPLTRMELDFDVKSAEA